MVRTRQRCPYAPHRETAAAVRTVTSAGGAHLWSDPGCRRHPVSRPDAQPCVIGPDCGDNVCSLCRCLHAAETAYTLEHADWCGARCVAAVNWLVCGARRMDARGRRAVSDSVSLADTALFGHCLDVSGRICACGPAHVARSRSRRPAHQPEHGSLLSGPVGRQPATRLVWRGRSALSRRRGATRPGGFGHGPRLLALAHLLPGAARDAGLACVSARFARSVAVGSYTWIVRRS